MPNLTRILKVEQFPGINERRYLARLTDYNQSIESLNKKIDIYNECGDASERITLLKEIDSMRRSINARYSLNYITAILQTKSVERRRIYDNREVSFNHPYEHSPSVLSYHREECMVQLEEEIKKELKTLGIQSITALNSASLSTELTEFVSNMDDKKLSKFMRVLWTGDNFEQNLQALYEKGHPEYERFKVLLSTYRISPLSIQKNSRSFVIETPDQPSLTLRIETRNGNSKVYEEALRGVSFPSLLPTYGAERRASFLSPQGEKVFANLFFTDHMRRGTLQNNARGQDQDRFNALFHYYKQMMTTLLDMQKNGVAFSAPSNEDWLIDDQNNLRIANTDSFIPCENNGKVNQTLAFDLAIFPAFYDHLKPNELRQNWGFTEGEWGQAAHPSFSAHKMHVYMVGKNMYQFLTRRPSEEISDVISVKNSFSTVLDLFTPAYPIFKTAVGLCLKNLIQRMTIEGSMTLSEALAEFKTLAIFNELTQNNPTVEQEFVSWFHAAKKTAEQSIRFFPDYDNRDQMGRQIAAKLTELIPAGQYNSTAFS